MSLTRRCPRSQHQHPRRPSCHLARSAPLLVPIGTPLLIADAMLHPWSRLKIGRGQNVHDIDFDCCMPRLR
jgi:hypothetical protein